MGTAFIGAVIAAVSATVASTSSETAIGSQMGVYRRGPALTRKELATAPNAAPAKTEALLAFTNTKTSRDPIYAGSADPRTTTTATQTAAPTPAKYGLGTATRGTSRLGWPRPVGRPMTKLGIIASSS